ncbi:MAG: tetratricopeptide repeat protein [Verrucomicrobia bacterium]|nr:tetratricopeptide repeat protein [Verrucomicrobiota bacterium]
MFAGMLLVPAWQWPEAPLLLWVPRWLQPEFVAWLLACPQGFSRCGQAEAYSAHVLQRLEELHRWVKRGPDVDVEREVLAVFARSKSALPLYFAEGSLRRHAELRGQLLSRALVPASDRFDSVVTPRAGRKLRVGIINRHLGPQTETYTTLPTFEQLDPERFEVTLFVHRSGDSALEAYCGKQASELRVLTGSLEAQVAALRAAALDVAVFGTNLTAICNEVTRLALHRVAPLQVANNSSCITSGLPNIDLYVSGSLAEAPGAAGNFSERLGLLPGPAHAFNYEAEGAVATAICTRAEFGLPSDAIVFVSAANYFKIIPEMQETWARLLAAVPGAYLLLHPFNPNWASEYPVCRFQEEFGGVLASHGVAPSRWAVSTRPFPTRADVKTLLELGDIYLDTYPFAGVNSLVDPLELGLPVVAWEGATFRSRMGAALLRELEVPELIAENRADYLRIAQRLANESDYRESCAGVIRARMGRTPVFLDPLAASEAFGDLIETAYDELVEVGREAFRARREPIRAMGKARTESEGTLVADMTRAREILAASPADPHARHAVGRALVDSGRPARAVTYLLGALQADEGNGRLWIDVARALQANGQLREALQALEAGLRIDQTMREGWTLYAGVARTLGAWQLAQEAEEVARQMALPENGAGQRSESRWQSASNLPPS